jgi:signal transduction histidine kinase
VHLVLGTRGIFHEVSFDDDTVTGHDLRPPAPDADLPSLLCRLGREPGLLSAAEVRVEVQPGELPMDEGTATALFRVAQEALGNVDQRRARGRSDRAP